MAHTSKSLIRRKAFPGDVRHSAVRDIGALADTYAIPQQFQKVWLFVVFEYVRKGGGNLFDFCIEVDPVYGIAMMTTRSSDRRAEGLGRICQGLSVVEKIG